jgi:phosphatidylethanolamine/phosphatidyl-N-methylethanolamine N-methyltransferase
LGTDPTRYWNRHAGRYDRSMWLFGGPLPRAIARTAECITGAGSVLELAAGTGLFTGALSRVSGRVTATDFAPAMLERLRARAAAEGWTNVTTEGADAGALVYPDAAFDAVVAANVLHLLPDLDAVFSNVKRVLRPGGLFVAPTYCHDETLSARLTAGLLRRLTGFPGQRRFTVASLAQTLADADFRVERVERVAGLMPIGFVAARRARLAEVPGTSAGFPPAFIGA